MNITDNAVERAIRWLEEIRRKSSTVEPDWWLRMECGQVLDPAAETTRRHRRMPRRNRLS